MSEEQPLLFDVPPDWSKDWKGMPSFHQENLTPQQTIMVHFKNDAARKAFATLVQQTITPDTKSIWYPKPALHEFAGKGYIATQAHRPRYPIYVISKGRWESRLTVQALEAINAPYHVVIEPQEFAQYSAVIDPIKILTLPFSNLGLGSIPARNWVWEHAIDIGAERHWILDDNINGFVRLDQNIKRPVLSSVVFVIMEDFVDRYENIALAGPHYRFFADQSSIRPPFTLNSRVYSCILIKNDLPYRWRGRYNEDTDLSIRALTDGWCTVLFNALLSNKQATMTMKGGNTDELYQNDGRLKMAESLKAQHPHLVTITQKWGRWQHHVNYDVFRRNKLRLRSDVVINDQPNDYGMSLKVLTEQATNQEASDGDEQEAHNREGIREVAPDSDTGAESAVENTDQSLASSEDAEADRSVESEAQQRASQVDLFDPYIVAPDDP